MEMRNCQNERCGKPFEVPQFPVAARDSKRFCRAACRAIAHREAFIGRAAIQAYRDMCDQRGVKG